MSKWPKQAECRAFYGNPSDSNFESTQLTVVMLPFTMHMDDLVIKKIRVHKKCATSLYNVVNNPALLAYLRSLPANAPELEFSGSYNYRPMRGSSSLSTHAYGCAVDIAASINPFKRKPTFTSNTLWVQAFKAEGWVWGGDWKSPDGMHFQAAIV